MRGREFFELRAFASVAAHNSFSRAAGELGLSGSTLSQIVRNLEDRLGLQLLNRTTRSVSLTEAGASLLARFRPAMMEMEAAVREAIDQRDVPAGRVRILSSSVAADIFIRPALGAFARAHPDIVLDIMIEDRPVDIVQAGYDAAIRLGEFLDDDVVSARLGPDQRQIAVASPAYLEQHGRPEAPADLSHHNCINWRMPGDGRLYQWEFVRDGAWFSVEVTGSLIVSDRWLAVEAALQDAGIAFWAEDLLRFHIEAGRLVPLLRDWSAPFSGWHLYYPKQSHMLRPLRAVIDFFAADARRMEAALSRSVSRGSGG
jgi:DNA-binding transcriptional LysR family regulator